MKKYDHFEKYEWIGSFWADSDCLKKENQIESEDHIELSGTLSYSIKNGIQLNFLCSTDRKIKKSKYIHGILGSGEKCTLFGNFDPNVLRFHFGEISMCKGKITFEAMIFGIHITTEDKFDGIFMDFTNFQEFVHSQVFINSAKYSKQPIFTEYYGDFEISLINSATFDLLESNIDALFYCKNENVELEIKNAIKDVIKKYKNERLFNRTNIEWKLLLKNKNSLTIDEVIHSTVSIEQFLSLLIFSPIRRTKLSILRRSDEQYCRSEYSILTTLFDISKYKEKVLKKNLLHNHLPINRINIDFGKTIKNWFAKKEELQMYAMYIFSLSNKFGRITEPEIRSEIIINLVVIESIAQNILKNVAKKYDAPISHYDKSQISNILREILVTENIGKALSDLRGEIAHFAKSPKILKKISVLDLYTVQKCLSIIICSSIYEMLEIPEENITNFQEMHVPRLYDPDKTFYNTFFIKDNKD
jgi:hypothetical protein